MVRKLSALSTAAATWLATAVSSSTSPAPSPRASLDTAWITPNTRPRTVRGTATPERTFSDRANRRSAGSLVVSTSSTSTGTPVAATFAATLAPGLNGRSTFSNSAPDGPPTPLWPTIRRRSRSTRNR